MESFKVVERWTTVGGSAKIFSFDLHKLMRLILRTHKEHLQLDELIFVVNFHKLHYTVNYSAVRSDRKVRITVKKISE